MEKIRSMRGCSTLLLSLIDTPTITCWQTTVTLAPRPKQARQWRTSPLTRMNECEESNIMNEWRRQKEEEEVMKNWTRITPLTLKKITQRMRRRIEELKKTKDQQPPTTTTTSIEEDEGWAEEEQAPTPTVTRRGRGKWWEKEEGTLAKKKKNRKEKICLCTISRT